MNEHPIGNIMEQTMQKLKEMVDANTIVGTPITTPDGIWIVPISKLSFGFGCGGSDFPARKKDAKDTSDNDSPQPYMFGGGSGAGVSVTPVGFLVVNDDNVRMLPVAAPASTAADRVIDMVPGIVDKVSSLLKKDKKKISDETFDD